MENKKRVLSFLPFIISPAISAYLTYLVDLTTINSMLQRVFVFLFFTVFISAILFLSKAHMIKPDIMLIVSTIAFSLSAVILFQGSFVPQKKQSTITFEAVMEENASHAQEVWLCGVELDGKAVPISELKLISNNGWQYISEYDDYVYYPTSQNKSESTNNLTFKVFCKDANIIFAYNSWSGKVSYSSNGADAKNELLLYSDGDDSSDSKTLSLDLAATNSTPHLILCSLGAIVTAFIFIYLLLISINKSLSKKKKQSALTENFSNNMLVFSIYFLLVAAFFKIAKEVYNCSWGYIAPFLGIIALLLIYPYSLRILGMFKKMKIAETVLLFVVVLIISFQTVAEILFMDPNKTTVTFVDILSFIIVTAIVTVPVMGIALFIDSRTEKRFEEGEKNEEE